MKLIGLTEEHPSFNLVNWRYTIRNKELCQIIKTASFADFKQEQLLNWISFINHKENNGIMCWYSTLLKQKGWKEIPIITGKRDNIGLEKPI